MALIRCKKCGNLASSKSKACPACGEPIAAAEVASTPTVAEEAAANTPKTLNDILAERAAAAPSINDTMAPEEPQPEQREPQQQEVQQEPQPTSDTTSVPEDKVETEAEDDYAYSNAIADYEAELDRKERSLKGFRLLLGVLIVLLVPAAFFSIRWGMKVKTIEEDYAIVQSARKLFEEQNTMLQRDAESLVAELEDLKDQNDTMLVKYEEAVVMLEQLQREKTYNYEQLAKYKREVETLRGVMKGYLRQIDSLNTINSSLQAENVAYKKEISTAQLRADVAEEKADELNTKVRIGAVIRTSGIRMVALNNKSKEVRRIKMATRLRVDFELTANELAEPGEKSIYICITCPDGYVLSPEDMILFSFEGEDMMASAVRKVDYENQSVPVSIFYDGAAFEKGTYKVDIYIDGRHSGSQETYFE
ncbi:MAG: hypothetical protein IKC12_00915 [Alistipes sp.]|nr:hypothetical protein [Alistipes sp.]